MKVDFHLHVGVVWGGLNEPTPAPADRCAEYLRANQITHAGVCYSDRAELDKLIKLVPDIRIYKYQWITAYDQTFDDNIDGFKLHSHRGQGFSFGSDSQGLDYSSREMNRLLERMPENSILQYHTQGSASLNNVSRPYMIAKLATQHRHLKHIIVHSGSYGLQSYYPSKVDAGLTITALSQEMLVQEATLMANRLANVYLDSSTLIGFGHYKTQLLFDGFKKAALSSDWPYCEKSPYGPLLQAEKLLKKFLPFEEIEAVHERALHFLETPVSALFAEYGEIVNEFAGRGEAYVKKVLESKRRKK